MSEQTGARFIHKQDSKLQLSAPVKHAQAQRERRGLETSQKPAVRLSNWFEVLARTHLARGASAERQARHQQVMERIKKGYHKLFVIKPGNIPESYFALEVRLARERGGGNILPYDEYKDQKTKDAIAAQESSLDRWVDYLTSEDADAAGYPMWARYWAFMAVIKMGLMEKKTVPPEEPGGEETIEISFSKRDEHTAAQFPEVNPKALAMTIEAMQKHLEQQGLPKAERRVDNTSKVLGDAQFAQMLSEGSFAKIYAQFLAENPSITTETLKETRGEWVRYEQGSDATVLFESLQGHTLQWCTAGALETAQNQVDGGDFYVYYSLDAIGQPTIPRIAIRKEGDYIAEIRGIENGQHIDQYIGGVLQEKLADKQAFPNAKTYMQGAEDMQRVTEIEQKMGANYNDIKAEFLGYDSPSAELTIEDLRFIYELDRRIVSLGYGEDPRIGQILENRDFMEDMSVIFEITGSDAIALQLIARGEADFLAENLAKFEGLDHNSIALLLIETDQGSAVIGNIDKFQGLNAQVAQQLIAAGEGDVVISNLDKFQRGEHNAIAQQLIESGQGKAVVENLDKFEGLNAQVAQQLIAAGEGDVVISNLDKFQRGEHNAIALLLIESGRGRAVARNLDKFEGLDHNATVQQLVAAGEVYVVISNIDKFQGLNAQVAQQLIAAREGDIVISDLEAREGDIVISNLDKFQRGDHNAIALQLIKSGQGWKVARNLDKFEGLNAQIAQQLIAAGLGWAAARKLDKFEGLDHNAIAQQLFVAGEGKSVVENLDKFQGLNYSNEFAQQLIESGQGWAVARNLDKFEGLDHNATAQQLIAAGEGKAVAENLDKFQGLNYSNEFAQQLIESGQGEAVARNLDKFQGLNYSNEFAQQLIAAGLGWAVAENLDKFEGVDHNAIAQQLIESGEGWEVAKNLDKFEGLDHNAIAQQLIAAGEGKSAANNLDKFQGLSPELIKAIGMYHR